MWVGVAGGESGAGVVTCRVGRGGGVVADLDQCLFVDVAAATEIYTLSLHDALPIFGGRGRGRVGDARAVGRGAGGGDVKAEGDTAGLEAGGAAACQDPRGDGAARGGGAGAVDGPGQPGGQGVREREPVGGAGAVVGDGDRVVHAVTGGDRGRGCTRRDRRLRSGEPDGYGSY